LELVPYIVEVVPNQREEGTGATSCSDAKSIDEIKNRVPLWWGRKRWVKRERC
jgi:hypothetical protein